MCRDAVEIRGRWPQAELPRLAQALPDTPADAPPEVDWVARGELRSVRGGADQWWLHLQVRTTAWMPCQRCLQPMPVPLAVQRPLRFVADEAQAERLDEHSDDDVLACTGRLDLRELVEDELILALPLVPRHEDCPLPLAPAAAVAARDDVAPQDPAPHPFAALAALRKPDAR
jgi:uncharacterized protein